LDKARSVVAETDLMLIIGTSGVVQPAASMPIYAKRAGATLIEINPFESEISRGVDLWIQAPSGEALPQIVAAMGLV
jgi:NAD-dependent deacetylase